MIRCEFKGSSVWNGMDLLCGFPLWTSVFSVVNDFKTLTEEITVFQGGNTEFLLPQRNSTIPKTQKSDKVLADSSHCISSCCC